MPGDDSATSAIPPATNTPHWSFSARLACPFALCYLILYSLNTWDELHIIFAYFLAQRQLTRMPQP